MKRLSAALWLALPLIFIGAGCAQQTAIAPEQMNAESALSRPPANPGLIEPQVNVEESAPPAAATGETPAEIGTAPAEESKDMVQQKWPRPSAFPGVLPADELKNLQARIVTAKGEIVFEILGQEGPKAASNFIALARSGYFDGLAFHRVVPGFVIQGGDPLGNGTGGPGYKFEDDPVRLDYSAGIVAMANAGPDTNGSQFFIVIEDQPTLPKSYSIFGRVLKGLDVVRQIEIGDVMRSVTIESQR